MELRHLRYFVAVAEELNVTRAAARLRVAQPALSSQIKDLEDELDTRLFRRSRVGVQLTPAGKVFFQRARRILAEAAEAVNETRAAAGVVTGSLVLGYPSGLHLNFLRPLIDAFKRQHPEVQLDYVHGLPAEQLRALSQGRIDMGFINLPAPLDGMEHQVVWRVPFEVVLPRDHRLARRARFELTDLRGEDFVFCTRESRPEFYDDFFRQCANAGFRPHIVKEVGGYPTNMLGLVALGVGLSVLPRFQDIERIAGLVWRPLEKPRLWIDWALVWRKPADSKAILEFASAAETILGLPAEAERAAI